MKIHHGRPLHETGKGKNMMIAQAYSEWLTPREQQALATSCDLPINACFSDWSLFEHWTPDKADKTILGSYLPRRYLSHYTPAFFKQFAVCLITVAWKLAQPEQLPLASVGEELAAWAMINQAKVVLEDEDALARFQDLYFEDQDVLFLFVDEMDGIETGPVGQITGMTSLALHNWFRPFSETDPAYVTHPFSWNA